jgi:hypothetical protein
LQSRILKDRFHFQNTRQAWEAILIEKPASSLFPERGFCLPGSA